MTKFTFIVVTEQYVAVRPGHVRLQRGVPFTYTYTDHSEELTAWSVAGIIESHTRRLLRLEKGDQVSTKLLCVDVNADN